MWDYGGDFHIGFKWRGRNNIHILTSGMLKLTQGLDDYPRSDVPHPGDLHLDLISWMAYFAGVLKDASTFLNLKSDFDFFQNQEEQMKHTIEGFCKFRQNCTGITVPILSQMYPLMSLEI
jgi:hypothetical protein